ncbi:chemotaxis protein CheW [Massilia sp. YIM B04103]|uniref:chemotaxis protein CheW n=1 Tax=Massilia sp. YIM B04103 TaxID=2963106 RepID=UPI00210D4A7F|nr:chemotaxis protein CheW [Massilia sp. YIM B04103]
MTTAQAQELDDCWNRIGVAGDHSCAQLQQAIHCRNCPVYAGAAQHNLQRPLAPGYRREWAAYFRRPAQASAHHDASCVVFRIGIEWLSLPTPLFLQVAPQAQPHRLPHRAAHGLAGIVNVGGKLYPCVSLAALMGIDERDTQERSGHHIFPRLLLVRMESETYALPVAELHGIERYRSEDMLAPAATINKGLTRYLAGVLPLREMQIGCLDAGLLAHQLARTLR